MEIVKHPTGDPNEGNSAYKKRAISFVAYLLN